MKRWCFWELEKYKDLFRKEYANYSKHVTIEVKQAGFGSSYANQMLKQEVDMQALAHSRGPQADQSQQFKWY